jgi:indole-3-glycerol phosphate synthase
MSILDEIVRHKRHEVAASKATTPRRALEAHCATLPAPRDFERALAPLQDRARLVAEVKRASPSRGVLKADLDPVALASTYARHGVDAISVLTDAQYFRGSLDDLRAVRAAVDVPLLRKDFTLDEYQLWEARAAGADAILLIVSILEPSRLSDLAAAAKGLGLAALVECHTAKELDVALATGARLIGINNRDLATFETRIDTTLALLPHIPPGPTVVSESGFFSGDDVRRVIQAGAHAVLVGEGLVKATDTGAKIRELRLAGSAIPGESGGESGGRLAPPIH